MEGGPGRRAGPGVLQLEHHFHGQVGAPSPVLLGPGAPEPPPAGQLLLPGPAHVPRLVVVGAAPAPDGEELAAQVLFEPLDPLVPEGLLLGGERNVQRTHVPTGPMIVGKLACNKTCDPGS